MIAVDGHWHFEQYMSNFVVSNASADRLVPDGA